MLYRASCLIIFNNVSSNTLKYYEIEQTLSFIYLESHDSPGIAFFSSLWFCKLSIGITLLLCCRWKFLFTQIMSAKLNPWDQEMLKRYRWSYHFEALEPLDGHRVLYWKWIELLVALVGQVIDSGKLFKCLWEGWKFWRGFYVRSLKISCRPWKNVSKNFMN